MKNNPAQELLSSVIWRWKFQGNTEVSLATIRQTFLPLPGNEVICLRTKITSCVVLQSLVYLHVQILVLPIHGFNDFGLTDQKNH